MNFTAPAVVRAYLGAFSPSAWPFKLYLYRILPPNADILCGIWETSIYNWNPNVSVALSQMRSTQHFDNYGYLAIHEDMCEVSFLYIASPRCKIIGGVKGGNNMPPSDWWLAQRSSGHRLSVCRRFAFTSKDMLLCSYWNNNGITPKYVHMFLLRCPDILKFKCLILRKTMKFECIVTKNNASQIYSRRSAGNWSRWAW